LTRPHYEPYKILTQLFDYATFLSPLQVATAVYQDNFLEGFSLADAPEFDDEACSGKPGISAWNGFSTGCHESCLSG
jgi:hypothetical protein